MTKRRLGRSGLEISPFVLGGNVFGWTIGQEDSFKVLDAFEAAGFETIDTADVYSTWAPGNHGGESEIILGNWMKKKQNRHRVIIATKMGKPMSPSQKGLSRKYISEAVDASLRRLQTDYIDLYQSHEDDALTPLEETLDAFTGLIRSGKVKAIGASNYSPARFAEALTTSNRYGYARYETLQPAYNLYDRHFEKDYQDLCIAENTGVLSYYPLASGFLTGKYRGEADLAQSARGASVKKYLNPKGFRILRALDQVAAMHRTTPAAVSIAWILRNPAITAPIASATRADQLDTLLKAVELHLSEEAMAILGAAGAD